MRVLVLGQGAREHALVDRLVDDPDVDEVLCAPGNPGIARHARVLPADLTDVDALVRMANREKADFTIVGPEIPLSLGVADRFAAAGRPIFGPTAAAARLESSKAFAKAFMARHGVPTARFRTCDALDDALHAVKSGEFGLPVVLKADGLAAGKGVVVAEDQSTAEAAVFAAMKERRFGASGDRLVVEECLTGPEVSFFVVCNGRRAVPIGTAQDHKRIFDDDRGPNTGGMGAFAHSPLVDQPLESRIMREIVDPVVAGMAADGHPFCGFLYVGLMLTPAGPKVIEFNVRLGDPEAQVILSLIRSPLAALLAGAARGEDVPARVEIAPERRVGVVLASAGYPESSQSGQPITGVNEADDLEGVRVYHAGTAVQDGQLVTSGGRVLTVVGEGPDFPSAIAGAYRGVERIRFAGMQFRSDIGRKALAIQP
jgi:phosphoribosylamine--glycine ligase